MPRGKRAPAEIERLRQDERRRANWKRWGPYLAERQWATVREDYSADGDCWRYFPHDHARSRAYRWGEDGLLGITDRECRLCFALALWNGRDPILKERLFGLTSTEGNHAEDVKEEYFYLDSTPTHSYLKALYRYPQVAYPYEELLRANAGRGRDEPEFEILDTEAFADSRYFDVTAEYAKASPDDIAILIRVVNRGPEPAEIHVLPTLWFRNTWTVDGPDERWPRPVLRAEDEGTITAEHATLGRFRLSVGPGAEGRIPELLFTGNETDTRRLFGVAAAAPHVKDAFHELVIAGRREAVSPEPAGTKAAAWHRARLAPGAELDLRLRLTARAEVGPDPLGAGFTRLLARRRRECDEFYDHVIPAAATPAERAVIRQAYAGLLWSKQFYFYDVGRWLDGDPGRPAPPPERRGGRNSAWRHVYVRNVLSVPDKWEFPWFAAWDLAMQMVPLAEVDPAFAKDQLLRLLREWSMHPSGQLPAYEFAFSDVNPPVHAWACRRVCDLAAGGGERDTLFLERAFQKLLLNFTWWANREDVRGRQVFSGGFLGMDNIGVFDRREMLPGEEFMEQADGTAWVAFYCLKMLSIALELAARRPPYEDTASKFFNHFVAISDAMNSLGGTGLWSEEDGFYYDLLMVRGRAESLRVRSLVGLIPLLAVTVLEEDRLRALPGFRDRMLWFLSARGGLDQQAPRRRGDDGRELRLLSLVGRGRLERVLRYLLDEEEFLSPYGIRSLSRVHRDHPYTLEVDGRSYRIDYEPGESRTALFGGNSNWRGPIWLPINHLLIEALGQYHRFYGDDLRVECPTGSGRRLDLGQVAAELRERLCRLFLPDPEGRCPWHGTREIRSRDEGWRDLILFHEYHHAETGEGLGASHQTGWTALIARLLAERARAGGAGR